MLRENLVSSEHEIWDLGFVESEYSFYDLVEKQTLQTNDNYYRSWFFISPDV